MQIFLRCIWLQTIKEFIGRLTWLDDRLLVEEDEIDDDDECVMLLIELPSELLVINDAEVVADDNDELELVDRSELEVLLL